MASLSDFRRVADDVRNWGRWGDADEIGTLNLITDEKVQQAREPRQARQGLSVGSGLRLVGPAGRLPLPAEPGARDDGRRRRREHAARVRLQMAAEPDGRTAQRVFGRRPDALQRRHDHHAVAGGHPVGRAVARVLRGQALQRLPRGVGDQSRCVPLRYRQGGRQGHHVARGVARHRGTARSGHVLRTRRPDHPCRTRRGRKDAGRRASGAATSCWSGRVGGHGFCRPATARSPARAWTGRAHRGCTTTRSPRSPPTT